MKHLTVNDIKKIVETDGTASMNNLYVVIISTTNTALSRMDYFNSLKYFRAIACNLIRIYPTLYKGKEFSLTSLLNTIASEKVFSIEQDAIDYANEVTANKGYYTDIITLNEFIQEIIYAIDDVIASYEDIDERLEYCRQFHIIF